MSARDRVEFEAPLSLRFFNFFSPVAHLTTAQPHASLIPHDEQKPVKVIVLFLFVFLCASGVYAVLMHSLLPFTIMLATILLFVVSYFVIGFWRITFRG